MNENIDFYGHDLIGQEKYDDLKLDVSTASLSTIKPIYTKSQLKDWLNPSVDIRGIVLHHTYQPVTCNGINTIKAIRSYHLRNGFSDIAANFYSSDEDNVIGYTARSLLKSNYAHAYVSKPWNSLPSGLPQKFNYDRMYCNKYCFGLETIGNFDIQNPKTSVAMKHSIIVMAAVCEVYNLNPDKDLYFHHYFESKSCPGNLVKKEFIISEVRKEMNGNNEKNCKDLPPSSYSISSLKWAAEKGLIKGDSEGNLMPKCPITREDFIVILKRFYDFLKSD